MHYEHILTTSADGLETITMNRPDRRNALSEAHMKELITAFRRSGDAPDTRAIILAANGPVFSAGHDFADMAERDLDGMRRLLAVCTELMLTIQRLPQPIVACVHALASARASAWSPRPRRSPAPRAAGVSRRRPSASARSTTRSISTWRRPTRKPATSWRRAR